MNTRTRVADILISFTRLPQTFTIEMFDGTKYIGSLSDPKHMWISFNYLSDTKLMTENGVVSIDLYQVKDVY